MGINVGGLWKPDGQGGFTQVPWDYDPDKEIQAEITRLEKELQLPTLTDADVAKAIEDLGLNNNLVETEDDAAQVASTTLQGVFNDADRGAQADSQGGAGAGGSPSIFSRIATPGNSPGIIAGTFAPIVAGSAIGWPSSGRTYPSWGSKEPHIKREPEPWTPGEVFRGWRAFNVEHDEKDAWKPILRGYQAQWPERRFEALCNGNAEHCQEHLGQGHCTAAYPGCGVYMVAEREDLEPYGYSDCYAGAMVIAFCVGYGTVYEHTKGARVSHCRIEHLILTEESPTLAQALRERYGVPVYLEPEPKEPTLDDLLQKAGWPMSPIVIPSKAFPTWIAGAQPTVLSIDIAASQMGPGEARATMSDGSVLVSHDYGMNWQLGWETRVNPYSAGATWQEVLGDEHEEE